MAYWKADAASWQAEYFYARRQAWACAYLGIATNALLLLVIAAIAYGGC